MPPITLKCPNCGANLQITPDIETFACGHCGTQQIVRRDGGIVSLKVISDAIAGVKASTDRVAAELEIRRLREDVERFDRELQELDKTISQAKTSPEKTPPDGRTTLLALTGIPIAYLGALLFSYGWWAGIVVALLIGAFFVNRHQRATNRSLEQARLAKGNEKDAVERRIATLLASLK